jgi:hypothetical protein
VSPGAGADGTAPAEDPGLPRDGTAGVAEIAPIDAGAGVSAGALPVAGPDGATGTGAAHEAMTTDSTNGANSDHMLR